MELKNIYFVAYLLEGEGCFIVNGKIPSIRLKMNDIDIVEKYHLITKSTSKIFCEQRELPSKPAYLSCIYGDLAIQWMMTIYPLMGLRRKAKIREILHFWKSTQVNHRSAGPKQAQLNANLSGLSRRLKHSGYDENTIEIALGMKRLGFSDEQIKNDLLDKCPTKSQIM